MSTVSPKKRSFKYSVRKKCKYVLLKNPSPHFRETHTTDIFQNSWDWRNIPIEILSLDIFLIDEVFFDEMVL